MMNAKLKTALVTALLFLAVWIPRVVKLNGSVTVDERKWVARSANFYYALSHGRLDETFQSGHPGVTITWAGTLGFLQLAPNYVQAPVNASGDSDDVEPWIRQYTDKTPLDLLVAGRWWVVLIIAVVITLGYFPLRQLFGTRLAFLMTLFVAWDPFFLALSRQLHPDGLLANFTYLAWLYFVVWLCVGQAWRDLLRSGFLLGLACLTKAPAILMLPAGGLLVLLELWRVTTPAAATVTGRVAVAVHSQRRLWIGALVWGGIAALTFISLWPTMWFGALATLRSMTGDMDAYIAGHVSANYFFGRTLDDPGPFFYPVAYLFRSTPATLFGLMAVLILWWRRVWPLDEATKRRNALGLLIFPVVFAVGMTVGGKKFDRYLLPSFPVLDLLAVLGWAGVIQWVVQWRRSRRSGEAVAAPTPVPMLIGVSLVTLLLHGLLGFFNYPQYLTYYNPLVGGSAVAPKVMMVGWGEGLDLAAAWLNQQPNAENLRVASTYGDGSLSYFLRSKQPVQSFWKPDFWFDADYAVLYVNQWQRRAIIPDIVDYFADQTPAHVVRLHGLDLVHIYDMHGKPPPDFAEVYTESATDFDNQLRLAAYSLGTRTLLTGDQVVIQLYVQSLAPITKAYLANVQLIAPDGTVAWQSESPPGETPTNNWPAGVIRYDYRHITIPTNAAPGNYKVTVSFVEQATRRTLPPAHAASDAPAVVVTTLQVRPATHYAVDAQWDGMRVTNLSHETSVKPGQTFFVDIDVTGKMDKRHKLSLRLVDPTGKTLAQTDKVVEAKLRFDLTLPETAAPGAYTLVAVVYDAATLKPFPDQAGNFLTTLSQIDVKQS